jgi:hypothetical protein
MAHTPILIIGADLERIRPLRYALPSAFLVVHTHVPLPDIATVSILWKV